LKADVVSADGLPVRYEVRGDGAPALVFVHGWSCDRRYWDGQIDHFADRHRVVAVDLAGHGESGVGRPVWTMPSFGEDVVAVVEQLGLRDLVMVGHSMGGDVIAEAAVRLPGRVRGLVWVDVYRSLGRFASAEDVAAFMAPFRTDFVPTTRAFVRRMFGPGCAPDLVEWVANDMAAAPPAVALDAMKHALSNEGDVIAAIRKAAVPVVAINSDSKPIDAASLERHGVTAVSMSGGHFLMLEDPDSFNRLLADTIEEFPYDTCTVD
jgi:pimeloyl-ACP methyl ester carboxylesterase